MTTEATPREVGSNAGLGLDPEREAFETWWSGSGSWPRLVDRFGEGYKVAQTHAAWVAWQGAWKATIAVERERWRSAVVRADLQIGDGHIDAARQTLHAAMDWPTS